ncbi:hypothetical protein L9F63_022957, partial [Diploptera punctata]
STFFVTFIVLSFIHYSFSLSVEFFTTLYNPNIEINSYSVKVASRKPLKTSIGIVDHAGSCQ